MNDPFTEEETAARIELAGTWRALGLLGFVDTIFNHVSVRLTTLQGSGTAFLMNRSDRKATDATPADLVVVSKVAPADASSGAITAGRLLHHAVYDRRPDVRAIIHLHSPSATVVSVLRVGLLPLTQTAMEFFEETAYCSFAGVVDSLEEGNRIATALGSLPCALLKHHGLVAVGGSLQEAFYIAYYLERACRDQLEIMSCGAEYCVPEREVCLRTREQLKKDRPTMAARMWKAMVATVFS